MAEEKYEIIWTPNAIDDYKKVVDFLLQNWSVKVTSGFINIVESKIINLTGQPFIGIASEKKSLVRSILLTKHNRLYYRVKDNKVELLNILDTRQNPVKNPY